jgi:hypothetical protein
MTSQVKPAASIRNPPTENSDRNAGPQRPPDGQNEIGYQTEDREEEPENLSFHGSSLRAGARNRAAGRAVSLPHLIRFGVARAVLPATLSCQCRFHAHLLTRLQVEGVTLDVLNNFLLKDFSLKALERAFQAFAIINLHFRQRTHLSFLNIAFASE